MIINKPFTTRIDPNNHYTTDLHFINGRVKQFYMRGSIAWPELGKEGFALMAGYDLAEKTIIIFEEFPFWTTSHWLNRDGTIRERDESEGGGFNLGLIQFVQDNLGRYKCASYFYGGQHIDIYKRFGNELYSHDMTPRRLELIEVPYVKENGPGILLEKLKTQKFKGQADSLLMESLKQYVGTQDINDSPDNRVMALQTLLTGFEFQPWIDIGAEGVFR